MIFLFVFVKDLKDSHADLHGRFMTRWYGAVMIKIALAFAVLAATCAGASARTIEGRATVLDGDTIALEGQEKHIRLYAIDTPEKKQTCDDAAGKRYLCGPQAAQALQELVGRNGVAVCDVKDVDRYGRSVSVCSVNGVELNRMMVASGWALHYEQYSDGRYSSEAAAAKSARIGLWQGDFIPPWDWRKGARLASEKGGSASRATSAVPLPPAMSTHGTASAAAPSGDCKIKGNISKNGHLYHVPGGRSYAATKIDASKGERWFCSETEAAAAGWTPAG
jgi:endonuclease YncB( thermonuclease family)